MTHVALDEHLNHVFTLSQDKIIKVARCGAAWCILPLGCCQVQASAG